MDRIVAAALEICLTANGNRFQHCCIELRIFFATASNEGKIAARSASVFRAKKFRPEHSRRPTRRPFVLRGFSDTVWYNVLLAKKASSAPPFRSAWHVFVHPLFDKGVVFQFPCPVVILKHGAQFAFLMF